MNSSTIGCRSRLGVGLVPCFSNWIATTFSRLQTRSVGGVEVNERAADMATLKGVMPRLAAADFRTTVEYTGPLEHQYLMTHFREDYLSLWLDMRELLATPGIIRPFFKSRQVWKYVDLSDGFTYWVMPEWVVDEWEERFDPNETYVLNRQETEKHFQTGAQ